MDDTSAIRFGAGGGSSLSRKLRLLVLRGSGGRGAAGAGCGGGTGGAEAGMGAKCSCIDTAAGLWAVDSGLSMPGPTEGACWVGTGSLRSPRMGWP